LKGGSSHGFAHLHVRSGFSFGFGVARPEELVEATARVGMPSLALTDRDGLYGIPRFLEAAEDAGVSPVVGAEITMREGGHVVLLAESMQGYRSLCRLITAYRTSSEDRRSPDCPLGEIQEHTRGLICLTGAVPFGLLPGLILSGHSERAREVLSLLRESFGEGNLFVELTDDWTAGSRRRMGRVASFAEGCGVPTLATNEVAHLGPADHRLHETLVAASNLSRLPGPGYRPTDQLWLKDARRISLLFADRPWSLRAAAEIAWRCAGAVRLSGKVHVPASRHEDPGKVLVELALRGARERYGGLNRQVVSRLRRELSCIEDLGFAPYFLLALEAVEIAREKGVPVTGRGSAANSLVSYCLGLTQPEPFSNRLLFERFMHEERRDPPDIDLDFCSERRDEVRDELEQRHAHQGVAVAGTAASYSLRGAVRVAARALGHPPREIDDLSRHVPTRFRDRDRVYAGLDGWKEALREPAMRGHPLQDTEKYRLLLELSAGLAGRLQGAGTHNGGLVFGTAEHHLSELVPLEPSGKEGLLRCQYDKDGLEYCGIPKLDILGLKMHTALHKAGELATRRIGKKVDPLSPPQDDKETFRLVRTGRNAGMFQLESPGQMQLSRRLKPRRFSDLVAQISLFRPGPVRGDLVTPYVLRRNGREPYSVPLPELDDILRPTYGVLMYQEQVLEVARAVAGFALAEGDGFRRAMTKDRGSGAMVGLRQRFLERAAERGVPGKAADTVFDWMEGFASYGFLKAHAASFAYLSYASAYMRVHYPAEFFCGLLNSQPMGFYSPRVLLNEARRIGLGVLPPDVFASDEGFSVEKSGTALRVGLSYSRGLSRRAIEGIIHEREARPFASVADLYRRTPVEKDALKNLIKGGFLDPLADRAALLAEADRLPKKRGRTRHPEIPLPHPSSWWEARESARRDPSGASLHNLPMPPGKAEREQKAVLSLDVVRHPLSAHRRALKELGVVPSQEILDLPHGTRVRAAGLIECLQRPPTKSGRPVYFLLLEDERGLLQATIFERVYEKYGHLLHQAGAFLLEGRVEQDDRRGFSFLVEQIGDLGKALARRHPGTSIDTERAVSASGSFIRARKPGRRAG
jgi:error-prone DNA polymerase